MDNKETITCKGGCSANTWYLTGTAKESVYLIDALETLRHRCTCAEA